MDKFSNEGGINGIGEQRLDTNSADFKLLKEKISAIAQQRSPEEKLSNQLLGLRFRMMTYLSSKGTEEVVSVGIFLQEAVELTGTKHKDFAAYIGYKAPNISAIYKGRKKINIDLALKLASIFSIPALLWLQIQSKNEMLAAKSSLTVPYNNLSLKGLLEQIH